MCVKTSSSYITLDVEQALQEQYLPTHVSPHGHLVTP
jgi:hypothetical protein